MPRLCKASSRIYRERKSACRSKVRGLCRCLPHSALWEVWVYTTLYYTLLYYTILYYTILYYTILYYTILYYTILPKGSKVVPFGQYIIVPKKKIGHNQKGTTLEPLGILYYTVIFNWSKPRSRAFTQAKIKQSCLHSMGRLLF